MSRHKHSFLERFGFFFVFLSCLSLLSAKPYLTLQRPGPARQKKEAKQTKKKANQEVDDAIVKALHFLASKQNANGSWRHRTFGQSPAMTSLAIMAFMAAGHVPGEGPYGKQLEKAIDWVLDQQKVVDDKPGEMTVILVGTKQSHGPMYTHGICTLMLAEVVGMLKKDQAKRCRKTLEKAVRLILESQDIRKNFLHQGGWRYSTTSRDSDLSVTGWQLLALRAAKNVGCDVPAESIDSAVKYVKRCQAPNGRGFGYMPRNGATATRTGTGITCLEVCGKHKTAEALKGAEYLLQRPLQTRDHYFYYGVYYCSVGMFKLGGRYWRETRDHLSRILLDSQETDGSWITRHGTESSAGKIYSTSLSVLALAVEYQYLPIYQR